MGNEHLSLVKNVFFESILILKKYYKSFVLHLHHNLQIYLSTDNMTSFD